MWCSGWVVLGGCGGGVSFVVLQWGRGGGGGGAGCGWVVGGGRVGGGSGGGRAGAILATLGPYWPRWNS